MERCSLRQGDTARTKRLLEESLELRRQLGNKWGVGVSLGTLGWAATREGDWEGAMAYLAESLEVRQEIGDKGGTAWCLERLAYLALAQGKPEKAVRLLSAAAALRISIGSVVDRPTRRSIRTGAALCAGNSVRKNSPRFGKMDGLLHWSRPSRMRWRSGNETGPKISGRFVKKLVRGLHEAKVNVNLK